MCKIDLTKLTPYQREVLTALARRLSKNDVMRLLHLAESTTRIHSDAFLRAYAVSEKIFQESTFDTHSMD